MMPESGLTAVEKPTNDSFLMTLIIGEHDSAYDYLNATRYFWARKVGNFKMIYFKTEGWA